MASSRRDSSPSTIETYSNTEFGSRPDDSQPTRHTSTANLNGSGDRSTISTASGRQDGAQNEQMTPRSHLYPRKSLPSPAEESLLLNTNKALSRNVTEMLYPSTGPPQMSKRQLWWQGAEEKTRTFWIFEATATLFSIALLLALAITLRQSDNQTLDSGQEQ